MTPAYIPMGMSGKVLSTAGGASGRLAVAAKQTQYSQGPPPLEHTEINTNACHVFNNPFINN